MENKRITYTDDQGNLCVVIPAPGVAMEDVLKAVPAGKAYDIVDVAEIPADRTFRNAWKKQGKQCVVDVTKAKEICHCKRREKRAAELAPLDVEATIPGKAAQAEAKRQAIRDKHAALQVSIDNATTEAELKALIAGL